MDYWGQQVPSRPFKSVLQGQKPKEQVVSAPSGSGTVQSVANDGGDYSEEGGEDHDNDQDNYGPQEHSESQSGSVILCTLGH
jgi:hypothetical protein